MSPFVFLPGLFETSHIWRPTVRRMALRPSDTLCLDLPGHQTGETATKVSADLASHSWTDRTAKRIDAWRRGRGVICVGHSTGAMLSIPLARRHPRLFAGIVLVGGLTSGERARGTDPLGQAVASPWVGPVAFRAALALWLSSPALFRRGFFMAARKAPKEGWPMRLDPMRKQLASCDPMALRAIARWVLSSDVTADLDHLDLPVLALIGRHDPVVSSEHQLSIAKRARNARAEVLDCGHLAFAEAPGIVARSLLSFSRSVAQSSARRPMAAGDA